MGRLMDCEEIATIKRVGRAKDGESTSLNQLLLDNLCDTAMLGIEALEILRWWDELRRDGYGLRPDEVAQIEKLLKRARTYQRTGELAK